MSPDRAANLLNHTSVKSCARQSWSRTTTERALRNEEAVLNLKGREWQKLNAVERERVVKICFSYWRSRGFPYYRLNDSELAREYTRLEGVTKECILVGDEIQISMIGLRLANYFHPQMWSVKTKGRRSPDKCFNDDSALRRLISRALNVWTDRCAVNESNLRGMLITFSRTARVSNFRPTAAKAIIERYSNCGDTVLDFSAGYGGRLLGCLPLKRIYIGIDPCTQQVRGLRKMKAKLESLVKPRAKAIIHRACAEDFLPGIRANSVNLVFSSPPYFNTERYSNEKTQSYLKFPEYEQWLEAFIGRVILESRRILKPGGYFIINVADIRGYKLSDDVLGLATKHFRHTETLKLRLSSLPYLRARPQEAFKHESVFILRKE
jgi:SAM-dependent methyltransferase